MFLNRDYPSNGLATRLQNSLILMLLAAAVALGQTTTPPFTLSLLPANVTFAAGGSLDMEVQVFRNGNRRGPITLSLPGAPTGVTATFSRNPVTLSGARMTLNVSATVPRISYILSLVGTGFSVNEAARFTLNVVDPLPPPTVHIDATLQPVLPALPSSDPLHPRTLATLADAHHRADFVQDELIVSTSDSTAFNVFLSRWGATQVNQVRQSSGLAAPIYLVHLDPLAADTSAIPSNLSKFNPSMTGDLRFGNSRGLQLFAVAAQEAAKGLAVGLNFVAPLQGDFINGISIEGPGGPADFNGTAYSQNAFNWSFLTQAGDPGIGVTHAWQGMEFAGKLGSITRVAVIEQGGFAPTLDFPTLEGFSMVTGQATTGVPNPNLNSQKQPVPWHGTMVSMALAGRADNGWGGAGPAGAGPNAHLILLTESQDLFGTMAAIEQAAALNARVINMSYTGTIPAVAAIGASFFLDTITNDVRNNYGVLIFASAGNNGEDVNAEDCFIACWESNLWWPCEADSVLCIGGLAPNSRVRDAGSNYSMDGGFGGNTVSFMGPMNVLVGPADPNNQTNPSPGWVNGTSFSSPFVAGVASMIWAADPTKSADDIEDALRSTAATGVEPTGSTNLVVLADAALEAITGNLPPTPTITAPANNSTFAYGNLNSVTFTAVAKDFEQGASCCTFTWTSDKDGLIGSQQSIKFVFPTPGKRTITVTVKDVAGATGTASIVVNAVDNPPTMTIFKPVPGAIVYRGIATVFSGQGSDPNEVGFLLPCSNLSWSTNVFIDQKLTGCNPTFTFPSKERESLL